MDIVIPYDGNGEISLKIVLRSIERHFKYSNVFIVTERPHNWFRNINVVYHGDIYKSNKDANLFKKVLYALEKGVGEDFMFWSDDQVLIGDWNPTVVRNERNPLLLDRKDKWQNRMVRTAEYIRDKLGKELTINYDSHVAQPMKKSIFEQIKEIDYASAPGFCICTLYYGIAGHDEKDTVAQNDVKATFEKSLSFAPEKLKGKKWIGFNNQGFNTGVSGYLGSVFDKKSIFEK